MNEQEQQIRIAIVDDHEMFRAGVIATLQPHFDIVGQAADVEGSVAMIAQTKPDVVLLDVHVPGGEGGGGAEILVKSRAYSPNTVFLALSVSDSPQDVGSVHLQSHPCQPVSHFGRRRARIPPISAKTRHSPHVLA